MGIVNTTPDSFSDGGRLAGVEQAVEHGLKLWAEGAAIIDVGGESTRPGAAVVSVEEENRRVLPVIEALVRHGCVVSVDTRKPEIMHAAIQAGAAMINDVMALRAPGALEIAAASDVAICLMHIQGEPQSMQQAPYYVDVVEEIEAFLLERVGACVVAGIAKTRLVIDPGFGFGKTLAHNLILLKRLNILSKNGVPVMAGLSRKALLGTLTGRDVQSREFASVAVHLAAVARGAKLLRVHDVAAMSDALAVWNAVEEQQNGT